MARRIFEEENASLESSLITISVEVREECMVAILKDLMSLVQHGCASVPDTTNMHEVVCMG